MGAFTVISLAEAATVRKDSPKVGGTLAWGDFFTSMPLGKSMTDCGIPIRVGASKTARSKSVVALGGGEHKALPKEATVTVSRKARHVVFLHFSIGERDKDGHLQNMPPGELLAEYTFTYSGGRAITQPIRRRFEIADCGATWGHLPFLCRPHKMPIIPGTDALWGARQPRVISPEYQSPPVMWFYTWTNPHPGETIATITFRSTGAGLVAVAAVTLCHTEAHPFPREANRDVKITFARKSDAQKPYDAAAELDRGMVTAQRPLPSSPGEDETARPVKGWGRKPVKPTRSPFMIEGYAAPSATLTVKTPESAHRVRWGDVVEKGAAQSKDKRVRVELMDGGKVWVRVAVVDPDTGKPTACRIHFHDQHGRYFAPHGHQTDVNARWFEDVGGDLLLGQTPYAYIDGRCQIWLPVGAVTVEVVKGFEYAPVHKHVEIRKGTKELTLDIRRWIDLPSRGYHAGDTHVHFLSPSTAHLEAQAEDLRVVNLLQSQWGSLFTNRGDFTGKPFISDDGQSIVYVSQENRQHVLGHISLLGLKEPVMPWCSGGPDEAELGGGMETCLSEWADECKKQGGLVVYPHFPAPTAEVASLVPTGRVDAAEIAFFGCTQNPAGSHDVFRYVFKEWYRFLNLGYRLPAAGGTDKMANAMPVGLMRTFVYVGTDRKLTYGNWCDGMRKGRTFVSSGPAIFLEVDGRHVGDTIEMTRSGGTVEFKASASCANPFDGIELVQNGRVVASATTARGGKQARLSGTLVVDKSCWLAARCWGRHSVHPSWPCSLGAHTSPVYVYLGTNDIFNIADAGYMLTLIQGGLDYVDNIALHRAELDRKDAVKGYLQQGVQAIHRRMHELGLPH